MGCILGKNIAVTETNDETPIHLSPQQDLPQQSCISSQQDLPPSSLLPCTSSQQDLPPSSPLPCTSSQQDLPLSSPLPCTSSQQDLPPSSPLPCTSSQQDLPLSSPLPCTSSQQDLPPSSSLPCISSQQDLPPPSSLPCTNDITPDQWKDAKKCAGASLDVRDPSGKLLSRYLMNSGFVVKHKQRFSERQKAPSRAISNAVIKNGKEIQKLKTRSARMEQLSSQRYEEVQKLVGTVTELVGSVTELVGTVTRHQGLIRDLDQDQQDHFFKDTLPKAAYDAMRSQALGHPFHQSYTANFNATDDQREQRLQLLRDLVNGGNLEDVDWTDDELAYHAIQLTNYRSNVVCHQASTTAFDAKARRILEKIYKLGINHCVQQAPFPVLVMLGYCGSHGIAVSSAASASDDF